MCHLLLVLSGGRVQCTGSAYLLEAREGTECFVTQLSRKGLKILVSEFIICHLMENVLA